MTDTLRDTLKQRADYTHKFNLRSGRHGWLRLTPAYSVKIVEELISACDRPMRIFDPFCGTSTTVLSAAYHGHDAATTDVNPFLVWFGRAKTAHYSVRDIMAARDACEGAVDAVKRHAVDPAPVPPIHQIDRWWDPTRLMYLRRLLAAITSMTKQTTPQQRLLLIAFCRTMIALSNAAFNHQSMSFKTPLALPLKYDMGAMFTRDVDFVLRGAADNPKGTCAVTLGDAKTPAAVVEGQFDRVITSPPYANRMSYIRELRPYMYWLGFLTNGRDAGELDWASIGGTWGAATSRLTTWERNGDRLKNRMLDGVLRKIAHDDNKSGRILSNYVAKYFDDMWAHLQNLTAVLASGAEVHYIVGNSTFYGVLLSTEQVYAAMLKSLGFDQVDVRPIRKRNSKKELIEFDVTARWPG